jgi:hypothetical protein
LSDFAIDNIKSFIVSNQSSFSISNSLRADPHKLFISSNLRSINNIHISSILIKIHFKTAKQIKYFLHSSFVSEILCHLSEGLSKMTESLMDGESLDDFVDLGLDFGDLDEAGTLLETHKKSYALVDGLEGEV